MLSEEVREKSKTGEREGGVKKGKFKKEMNEALKISKQLNRTEFKSIYNKHLEKNRLEGYTQ